jgi:hypothetical protein
MIFMRELSANYVKSLDYRCELVIEVRTKTGNELLTTRRPISKIGLRAIVANIF